MFETNDNYVVLTDENGEDVTCEFLDLIEYNSREYVVFLPENDDEVLILELEKSDDNEESYISVDDDETLSALFEIFKERFKDDFNFID